MRLLSIDFDYFVDADEIMRTLNFPDGNDSYPKQLNNFIWDNCIRFCPDISKIGVIKDYDFMCEFLKNHKHLSSDRVIATDSHREIEKFFDKVVKPNEPLDLVHIDYHHDIFVTGGNKLDCGNWLRFLMDLKPDTNVLWVRREDSDTTSFFGDFPYPDTTDITKVQGEFDYIFLCFSSPWTPPHLYEKFEVMVSLVTK